jgi:muramoyltetrapeptide carboxypeptidase
MHQKDIPYHGKGLLKQLTLPKRIYPGCTVGVAAPAGPVDPGLFSEGLKTLEAAGFRTHAPPDLLQSRRYLAGSDQHRAHTVNRLFADPGIDAVICARGGFGSMRILAHLDFDLIAANPKPFIGFSDASALLVALNNRCRMATFHGPVVTTLGGEHPQSMADLLKAISGDGPIAIVADQGRTIRDGRVVAAVSGGNLTTLCHLIGTPFEPQFRNHILFLEDCNEAVYRVDRMMSQMRLAGCLEGVAGIVLGAFEGCGPIEDIVSIFSELELPGHVPILSGVDAGHGTSNTTLPLGVAASLDAGARTLTYRQAATVA